MDSRLSALSSLKDDSAPPYIQPHYRESYRLALYALLCGGTDAYHEFLRAEQISHFLSEQEIAFVLENATLPAIEEDGEGNGADGESTYFPTESDEEVPDLDLGWPDLPLEETDTSISVLFNPPRPDTPSIKDVVRKQMQEARQLIALSMDVFTDVDIFKELMNAAMRGVVVYVLLDHAHCSSFINMAQRGGVNFSDVKTLRVRTVQGLQYQCQSSMKFHGALEQRFLLVDCRTVLYGTYSYTWTYEKLNLSMALVITGQLVSSYDEEFRRLYARSAVPPLPSRDTLPPVHFPNTPPSSQLALYQLHVKNRAVNGFANGSGALTRGVSVQERLHHFPEMGNLVRGHSCGGDLQKFNSMARLRMGTKDFGLERHGRTLRQSEMQSRSMQQHLRHQSRYGTDHNLIPFNSETSLNKWKLDSYLNGPLDASCEALSPLGSPHSSYTGLNELQSQNLQFRTKDMRQRLEEARLKRLSFQEHGNLLQSHESLRYLTQERPKGKHLPRGMEFRQSIADMEAQQNDCKKEREHVLTEGKRSVSHNDFKSMGERKMLTYDWHEAMSRSTSELDTKANDAVGKLGLGPKHQRQMESLTEIPEEKEGVGRVNSYSLAKEERKDDKVVSFEEQKDMKVQKESGSKMGDGLNSGIAKESEKEAQKEVESGATKVTPTSESKAKDEAKQDTSSLQRKNSVKSKMSSLLSPDDNKPGKKDPLQRKPSFRLQKMPGSNQSLRTESSVASTIGKQEQAAKKSQKSTTPPAEEKAKLQFNRFSPHRFSKRKTDGEKGSRTAPDDEAATLYEARKEKAYSRYEHLLGRDETGPRGAVTADDERRSATLSRKSDASDQTYGQSQSAAENKIGRFMQKMGNLIGNKSK